MFLKNKNKNRLKGDLKISDCLLDVFKMLFGFFALFGNISTYNGENNIRDYYCIIITLPKHVYVYGCN